MDVGEGAVIAVGPRVTGRSLDASRDTARRVPDVSRSQPGHSLLLPIFCSRCLAVSLASMKPARRSGGAEWGDKTEAPSDGRTVRPDDGFVAIGSRCLNAPE